jgi:hypothetical protein
LRRDANGFQKAGDGTRTQPDAYEHLARGFFRTGAVDDSKFTVQPISFTPAEPFGAIARRRVRWAVLILAGALLLLAAVAWLSARTRIVRPRPEAGDGTRARDSLGSSARTPRPLE